MDSAPTKTKRLSPSNRQRTNLLLAIGLLVILLVLYEHRATGIVLHEWLGLTIGGLLVVHLLLHWEWIAAVTRRFFGPTSWQARLNYGLNLALFSTFTAILFSGLMLSESILPLVGQTAPGGRFWHWLHHIAADLALWLVALHIALHWRWLANAIQRHIIAPLQRSTGQQPGRPAPEVE